MYYNTGCWARLIRLTEAVLEKPETFKPYYEAFTAGSMAALDQAEVVLNRPTFASVWTDQGVACAELRHAATTPCTKPFKPARDGDRTFFRKG